MRKILVISLIFLAVTTNAQIIKNQGLLPFIHNYTVEDYKAARQNFAIVQDNRGLMYFGNTDEAVLVFDGNLWQRIPVPNNSVFSLEFWNGQVYVGAKNDFGYLKQTPYFGLKFHSLLDKVPSKYHGFGQVWQIQANDKDSTLIFLSPLALFFYRNDTLKVIHIDSIDRKSLFLRMFKVNGQIYFTLKYKGIYRLENDTLVYVPESKQYWATMAMLPYYDHKILINTYYKGFFVYDGKSFEPYHPQIDNFLKHNIYRAIDVKSKYYVFALINGGVLITDYQLRPIQLLNVNTGLFNDKVQNLYLDDQNNLWLALDNGIASVRIFSPFTIYDKNYGFQRSTKVFSAVKCDSLLYIANSDGLYVRRWNVFEDKTKGFFKFKPVTDVEQKTYVIHNIDGTIFGVNDLGMYYISSGKAHYLTKERSLINFIRLRSSPNILIGVKDALQLFKKQSDGKWKFVGSIRNFKEPLRYIAEDKSGFLWGSDKTAGIYKIYLNSSYDSVVRVVHYNNSEGLHGLSSQYKNFVFQIADSVVFATVNGFYWYNARVDSFYPVEQLNKLLGDNREINLVYGDSYGNLWIRRLVTSSQNKYWELAKISKTDSGYVLINKPFYPFRNRIFSISQIDSNTYLIGTEGGFIHYDAGLLPDYNYPFKTYIRTVKLLAADSVIFSGFADQPQQKDFIPQLPYKYNDLRFVFAANYYAYPKYLQFRFFLKGYDKGWSAWTEENVKEYSNLPSGTYTFYVQARNIYGEKGSVAKYSFIIKPPWYFTIWAIILYVILAILFVWLIVYLYTLRLRRQKEYLEEQVRLRTLEIEQQKHEIEAQRDLLAKQNQEIRQKNKEITSSIEYAKRIQTAMLPLEETISKYLPEHFILYKPRDIVSGDFYWFAYKDGKIIIAAVDCTGHGVPGAFMSMIGAEVLNTIVLTNGVTDAAQILTLQNMYIRTALKQDTTDNQDGMDMALCVIDTEKGIVEFAGAKNPLIYIDKNHQLYKIRGDRQSIGGFQYSPKVRFTKHIIEIDSPMWFYIFSDGYQDQFGGGHPPTKFLTKNFYQLLHKIHVLDIKEQKQVLEATLEEWKGDNSQTDDILVIGFKL